MWPEDLISRALGSGKVIRVVLSDAKVNYDFAFRIPLCFEKRVNVGMCFEKRVHVRSDPSPTPLLFGVGGSGRRPLNPPTPEGSGVGIRFGPGVWELGKGEKWLKTERKLG